ncbi:probable pectinesterase 68 [Physcomitrium patens]|uniref:pectinesterase n=1 Tax=Physcomitrium patens TaxID=3218 RepID=A0A7I4FN14_PHYPA|nr:probable pectinesterase 68 [Physcomitrium patens]|eukprot:XP_024371027.1 probable pectinesterase 68 [Physcomitrella patens]
MAEHVILIPNSRYVILAAMVVLLSSMPDPCHGQSWWSWASSPPSPSASTNSSTATPPSPLYTSPAPPPSPSAPTTPATPPSPTFSVPSTPAAPPSPTFGVPTTPSTLPSSAPTTSSTTSTTLIVMTTSFFFGPETIYTSVQDAIDAVPENNTDLYTIEILSGTYTEKVSIPATKPFITLQGAGRNNTIISYNDTANSTGSTMKSATFTVFAANFTARNVTFQNSAPHAVAGETGAQAVALRIAGDMAAFYGCGFISSQDTICDEEGRHYFRDCYVEGNIDIIWGNGQSLYEYTQIQSTANNSSGSITAQGRASDKETTGFTFVGGSITGTGDNILGRAYGLYSRVFFIDTYMEDIINPVGWSDWPTVTASKGHEHYGEYGNTGPGANLTGRVSWMVKLTEAEAANFSSLSFIDGSLWLSSQT